MRKIQLLIVDSDQTYTSEVAGFLTVMKDVEIAGIAHDGLDAQKAILRLRPEVVVMDLVLRRLNGISLLKSIGTLPVSERPVCIICTYFGSETAIQCAQKSGADYFLNKPVPLFQLYECILDTAAARRQAALDTQLSAAAYAKSDPASIQHALLEAGISPRLSGFYYLEEALRLVIKNDHLLNNCSRGLYAEIGKNLKTSSSCVERCIRTAIHTASARAESALPRLSNRRFLEELLVKINKYGDIPSDSHQKA